jgi:hypothetical protein
MPDLKKIDFKECRLYIRGGGAEEVEVVFGEGDFSFDRTTNINYELNRGKLSTVSKGDEAPLEVRFDARFIYLKTRSGSGADVTIYDALYQEGGAASWESSDPDVCQPYAVDLFMRYTPNCPGAGNAEEALFPLFRVERGSVTYKNGQLSFNGKCNVTKPTLTRSVASTQ